jgi:DNA repair protein RecO (recombination protein O)
MRVQLDPAYVVHSRPYRETSLLLEALTQGYGRIGLVAKGARAARSPFRGLLQVCRPLLLSWSARGELGTLTGAEPAGAAAVVTGRRLWSAFYMNELIMRLVPRDDPCPALFAVYRAALDGLAGEADEETVLRGFEKRLLMELGYGLILDREADTGNPIDANARYHYRLDLGPVRAEAVGGLMVHGRTLLGLGRDWLGDDTVSRREAKLLTRAALAVHLGDRPLKSRELFEWAGRLKE